MANKLKVGIIGIGAMGQVHADCLLKTRQVEIAALCDVHEDRLKAQGKVYGVKHLYDDYAKLLKADLDAVLVCVGNALHREVAIAALESGRHVLLEKPMALNAAEAADIAAAAAKAKGMMQMGMCWRHHPACTVLREYVQKGLLGEIYHIRAMMMRRRGIPGLGGWFTTMAESGGGPMIDLGVHWFDISMWLSGHWNPTAVSAKTYAKFGPRMKDYAYVDMWAGPPDFDGTCDVEDYSTGFVRFGGDATLSFDISWAGNAKERMFVEILGDKGGARMTEDNELTILTEHQGRVANISPLLPEADKYDVQAQSFVDACMGKHPPIATADEGLTVMKLIDAIYRSSEANAEVTL